MIAPWMGRTELLLGSDRLTNMIDKHVLVVGLGGVGAVAAEMICRAGVREMTIIDADTVEASNRNRQLPALSSTENKLKAEVLAERFKDINPDLKLHVLPMYINKETEAALFERAKFDYAVDAIDTLSCKVGFIKTCISLKIPLISSMGAGGRIDPSLARIADISESYGCHLAKDVRKRLHKLGIYTGVKVVFSPEVVNKERLKITPDDMRKRSVIGTISYMPAIFGCMLASVVLRDLAGMPLKSEICY